MGCAQPPENDDVMGVAPLGGGLEPERSTGANALFCLTAEEIMFAGQKENIAEVLPLARL